MGTVDHFSRIVRIQNPVALRSGLKHVSVHVKLAHGCFCVTHFAHWRAVMDQKQIFPKTFMVKG